MSLKKGFGFMSKISLPQLEYFPKEIQVYIQLSR